MSTRFLIFPLIFCFLILNSAHCANINSNEPDSSDDLLKIDRLYNEIEDQIRNNQLIIEEKYFEYCMPYEDTARVLYINKGGGVRSYRYGGGSDDSSVDRRFYYDKGGNLRLAVIFAGASNGTKIRHKIYFDKNRNRLSETQELIEGKGYTFPKEWPEEDIVYIPRKALNAQSKCEEIKK